jgi:hypothetical protein
MAITDGFEKLVKLPEVYNETDLELDELDKIAWEKVGEESALGVSAITYTDPDDTIVKKVWHDGMTEYYYTV